MTSATITHPLVPQSWDQYRGQNALKSRLAVHIASAKAQSHPLPDILLAAPAGYGKTTMATLIAGAMGKGCTIIRVPFSPEDLRDLGNVAGSVLVLDEIHRLSKPKQEELLTIFDGRYLKPKGRPIVYLGGTTVIGCTTERDALIDPLRDRFMIQPEYEQYNDDELTVIVQDMASRVGVALDGDECGGLARASGGVPRKAGQLILAARDMMYAYSRVPNAREVLEFCNLQYDGLGVDHVRYMRMMWQQAESVGMPALRNLMDMSEDGVRDVERLISRLGYITPTKSGRELTELGGRRAKELLV